MAVSEARNTLCLGEKWTPKINYDNLTKTSSVLSEIWDMQTLKQTTKNKHIIFEKYTIVWIFTARRYASAVLAVIMCLSVCLSVRLSQVGVVQRWLNLQSD